MKGSEKPKKLQKKQPLTLKERRSKKRAARKQKLSDSY
jgi:hypothetical protein